MRQDIVQGLRAILQRSQKPPGQWRPSYRLQPQFKTIINRQAPNNYRKGSRWAVGKRFGIRV